MHLKEDSSRNTLEANVPGLKGFRGSFNDNKNVVVRWRKGKDFGGKTGLFRLGRRRTSKS